jgi:hypothetical protein
VFRHYWVAVLLSLKTSSHRTGAVDTGSNFMPVSLTQMTICHGETQENVVFGVFYTGGKFAAGVKDTGGQPLMSWIPVVHLWE